jgi:hypothetical protein
MTDCEEVQILLAADVIDRVLMIFHLGKQKLDDNDGWSSA